MRSDRPCQCLVKVLWGNYSPGECHCSAFPRLSPRLAVPGHRPKASLQQESPLWRFPGQVPVKGSLIQGVDSRDDLRLWRRRMDKYGGSGHVNSNSVKVSLASDSGRSRPCRPSAAMQPCLHPLRQWLRIAGQAPGGQGQLYPNFSSPRSSQRPNPENPHTMALLLGASPSSFPSFVWLPGACLVQHRTCSL
jgi:hypothetical protein